jgi:hypothetical protein
MLHFYFAEILRLGYRLQMPYKGGFLFRIAALAYINYKPGYITKPNKPNFGMDEFKQGRLGDNYKNEFGVWLGLSCGFTF